MPNDSKYPLTEALLAYWRHPYSNRLLEFAARLIRRAQLHGLPSILD